MAMEDMKQKIRLRFFTSLRQKIQKKEDVVELSGEITVIKLLTHISKRYNHPFIECNNQKHAQIQLHFQLLVNGKNITHLQGLNTKLKDGDEITIVPPVGGG